MPLIRYRTGDFARWREKACSCGLAWPRITEVVGKYSSLTIYGDRGGRFSLSLILRVVNFLVNEDLLGNFRQYRFIQEREGELVMEFVPGPGFDERVLPPLVGGCGSHRGAAHGTTGDERSRGTGYPLGSVDVCGGLR
jgi:hypothetical protein